MLDITIKAPEEAGVATITELRDELISAIKGAGSGAKVVLDLSGTSLADSSFAQLVAAFKREAIAKGLEVSVVGMGGPTSLMEMLSCDKFLEDSGIAASKAAPRAGGKA
ncbi:MAG TPA: STAS domain-containing protein [Spirochaetales bacterium]|nr:STAS domain-containing protein [Spirochaetales bacterium]